MTNTERPFLDFYEKHSIIPTKLEITDKEKFFQQRNYLFETLGIPTRFLSGTRILELGPGTGQKAAHLLSLNPSSYAAIDNNLESIKATSETIAQSGFTGITELFSSDFLNFENETKYDLVLAELVVPTQREPIVFLQKLMERVNVGGLLIFTCMDPISLFSETLRIALVKYLQLIDDDLLISSERITDFFKTDLDLIPGMNRKRSDWAIDQIIKPPIGPLLDIPQALYSLKKDAIFHGSSPRFLEDFRWYKSPKISVEDLNFIALENYWKKSHNFLDFRFTMTPMKEIDNKELFNLCSEIYSDVHDQEWSEVSKKSVLSRCEVIHSLISQVMPETAASLKSFLKFWQSGIVDDLDAFRPWWGRGTQYISVIKS